MSQPTHAELCEDEDSFYTYLHSTHGHTMSTHDAERQARNHGVTLLQLEADHAPFRLFTPDRRRVFTRQVVLSLGY